MAVGFAMALGTTAWAGDEVISVAAASETVARNGNEYSNMLFTTDSDGMIINVHSHGWDVGWPWGFANLLTPNDASLGMLGWTFTLFSGYSYGC